MVAEPDAPNAGGSDPGAGEERQEQETVAESKRAL
jgi:hypothetical protein